MPDTRESSSLLTVLIAFGANILVAIAKTVAAVLTGSASLVAESAHSWADAGNEIFLIKAERSAARPGDASHPGGYGREAYVWSLFAAVGLFTAGAVVSVMHGVSQLATKEPAGDYTVAYAVLAIAFVFESVSFIQSFRQAHTRAEERGTHTLALVLRTSNPTLRAVFAEDAAALIGLIIAFLGVLLHQVTGNSVYDAVGSILVGVLLAVVAIVLIDRNRRFLVGEPGSERIRQLTLSSLLENPEVQKVTYLHLEYVGADSLFVIAAIDLEGEDREPDVARALASVEDRLEENPYIAKAVLTLSRPGADALVLEPAG